jgi:hypothetical protein
MVTPLRTSQNSAFASSKLCAALASTIGSLRRSLSPAPTPPLCTSAGITNRSPSHSGSSIPCGSCARRYILALGRHCLLGGRCLCIALSQRFAQRQHEGRAAPPSRFAACAPFALSLTGLALTSACAAISTSCTAPPPLLVAPLLRAAARRQRHRVAPGSGGRRWRVHAFCVPTIFEHRAARLALRGGLVFCGKDGHGCRLALRRPTGSGGRTSSACAFTPGSTSASATDTPPIFFTK